MDINEVSRDLQIADELLETWKKLRVDPPGDSFLSIASSMLRYTAVNDWFTNLPNGVWYHVLDAAVVARDLAASISKHGPEGQN